MPPAARLGDMHVCPLATPGTPPIPHVGGPIMMGCPTVMIGFKPAARVGDMAVCVGPPDAIAMGSLTVVIGFMPAARVYSIPGHSSSSIATSRLFLSLPPTVKRFFLTVVDLRRSFW